MSVQAFLFLSAEEKLRNYKGGLFDSSIYCNIYYSIFYYNNSFYFW